MVQPGDSLFAIATAVGSSVEDLIVANCLSPDQNITPGVSINVPNAPVVSVATGVPVFPTGTLEPLPECTTPGLRIIAPVAGDALTGTFNLVGAASPPPGGSYRVEIRPEFSADFTLYNRSIVPVTGGVLTTINSDLFDDGQHTIRVTLYDATGTPAESCAIPVIFR
jgi:LysM repeat protein